MKTKVNSLLDTFLNNYLIVIELDTQTCDMEFLHSADSALPLDKTFPWDTFCSAIFSRIKIHEDDLERVIQHLNIDMLRQNSAEHKNGTLFAFRTFQQAHYVWFQLELFIPTGYGQDTFKVLLCLKNVTQNRVYQLETLSVFNHRIHKIGEINLTTGNIHNVTQRTYETHLRRYPSTSEQSEIWSTEESLLHPDDVSSFRFYTEPQRILRHFQRGSAEYSFFYRRKNGSLFKWVRLIITPTSEYRDDHLSVIYIIEDMDTILSNLMTTNGQLRYLANALHSNVSEDPYHENLMHILSYFTQRYIHFFMIDLKNDLYISYKVMPGTIQGTMPFSGIYSTGAKHYIERNFSGDQHDYLLQYTSIDTLRQMLTGKTSFEFSFTFPDGRPVKNICTTIEAENGIPTKAISYTFPETPNDLLKIKTFGNFEVFDASDHPIRFTRRQSRQLLAYLIDKQGLPVSPKDIAVDVLERDADDLNAIKYISALTKSAITDLKNAGYTDIIEKEWNSLRVNVSKIDCDYYHLIAGDASYFHLYHNEYMKEYSWAEETNSELLSFTNLI